MLRPALSCCFRIAVLTAALGFCAPVQAADAPVPAKSAPAKAAAAPAKPPANPEPAKPAPPKATPPKPTPIALDGPVTDLDVAPPASGTEVTVYLNNLAMVREHRTFRLPGPLTRIAFAGVANSLQPETALFQVLKGPPLRIVEQNFDFDLLTPAKLLERAVGHDVTIVTSNPITGIETSTRATVLSTAGGMVLQMNGKIYTNVPGRIVYDSLPAGMHAAPALVMTAAGTPGQDMDTELSYLTTGLSWRADYVMQYDPDGNRMDFNAWASVTNGTGMEFKDATLKLVTGEVKRDANPRPMLERRAVANAANAMAAPQAAPLVDGATEEAVAGNHTYVMPRLTTLAPSETKQLALLSAQGVAVKRDYVVHGASAVFTASMRDRPQNTAADMELSFKNDAAAKLDTPLPAGIVRVYSLDDQGAPQFVGESRIDHQAEGSDVTINAGRDYDLSVTREQVIFVRASDNIVLSVWRITLRNAKSKPATVQVQEQIPGAWEITKESQSHTKTDSGIAEWDMQIPAKGQVVLDYNVKTQF